MSFVFPSVREFFSYFKTTTGSLSKRAIGLSDGATEDETMFTPLARMEQTAMNLMIFKKGYKQTNSNIPKNFHLHNNLVRFFTFVCTLRMFIIYNTNDETTQTYMGDPLYQYIDRKIITLLVLLANTIYAMYREFIFHIEGKGCLVQMTILEEIKVKGFDKKSLRLTDYQVKALRKFLYTFIVNIIRFIKMTRILIPTLFALLLILNSRVHDKLKLLSFGIPWATFQSYCNIYLHCGYIASTAHIIIVTWVYLCQVNSLVEIIRAKVNQKTVNESSFKELNKNMIIFMNEMDKTNKNWRYAIFYNSFLGSFQNDLAFFGSRLLHNKFISTSLVCVGALGMITNGAALYVSGAILSQLHKIHGFYLSLVRKANNISYQEKFKICEILERIISEYSGIKCGDSFIITKSSVVFFVFENASILMMFTVNASYFEE